MSDLSEMEKFSKFVREKRTALGISVSDLNETVTGNRRGNYISLIEQGNKPGITIDMMEKILKALNSEIKYNEL